VKPVPSLEKEEEDHGTSVKTEEPTNKPAEAYG
jgi:hypothetical protein